MRLYRSSNRIEGLKNQKWHIVNPETLLGLCGDDSQMSKKHFEGYESEEFPKDVRLCKACEHAQHGYKVRIVQYGLIRRYGQIRRYGPSVYRWRITDLSGERTAEEVRTYCKEHIRDVPERGDPNYHPLCEHFAFFRDQGNGVYVYQTEHDWTG